MCFGYLYLHRPLQRQPGWKVILKIIRFLTLRSGGENLEILAKWKSAIGERTVLLQFFEIVSRFEIFLQNPWYFPDFPN